MEFALAIVLTGVLLAAVVSFVVMGLDQRRRRNRAAGRAHASGFLFAPEDPFDVPRRYRGFALMEVGHSPRAYNVTYGRMGGLPLRAFDFRYEVGHGTRRLARQYAVVVVETVQRLTPMLMWNRHDVEVAPLAVRRCVVSSGLWRCDCPEGAAELATSDTDAFASAGGSIQTLDGAVMLCCPEGRRRSGRSAAMEAAMPVLRALCRGHDTTTAGRGRVGVEKADES